jgi:hypothetical protein
MIKTMRVLSMASFLMTGAATAMAANDGGGVGSKAVTGTETGSQQTNTPATGSALGATSTQAAPTSLCRSDRVDSTRCNEPFASLPEWRRRKELTTCCVQVGLPSLRPRPS